MNSQTPETPGRLLVWAALPADTRQALWGKLAGLWDHPTDQSAFDSFTIDKQQALLLLLEHLQRKELWNIVRKIENIYGEGGVGMKFVAWPFIHSTLSRRKDFTRLFAGHKDTSGGFYEKGRPEAVLHFLYQDGPPRKWFVHFDLYSPVYSPSSAWKHLRFELLGKLRPNWRMIRERLAA